MVASVHTCTTILSQLSFNKLYTFLWCTLIPFSLQPGPSLQFNTEFKFIQPVLKIMILTTYDEEICLFPQPIQLYCSRNRPSTRYGHLIVLELSLLFMNFHIACSYQATRLEFHNANLIMPREVRTAGTDSYIIIYAPVYYVAM